MNSGYVLSISAALVLGVYFVTVKRYFSHYPPTLFVGLTYSIGAVWYYPMMAVTKPTPQIIPSVGLRGSVVVVGTAVFTIIALLTFYHALAIGDISYIAPISKIVPVFVLPLEVIVLGESLSQTQIAGVVIATTAVYIANYRRGSFFDPFRRLVRTKAPLFALSSAAAFGIVDIGKRLSMQEFGIAPAGFIKIMLLLIPIFLLPSIVSHWNTVDWWSDRKSLVVAGLVFVIGQHLVASAFETLPASIVSPIVNTQAIVAVLLGSLLLNESYLRIKLAAASFALVGVVLISLG